MKPTLIVLMFTLASVIVACGGDDDTNDTAAPSPTAEPVAEIPVVEITKTDDGFEAPDSIPGGLTRFRVHNAGTQQYSVSFGRFTDVGTLEQFNDAIRVAVTDFAAAAEEFGRLTDGVGGTGSIPPGGSMDVVLDLPPGRYVMVRLVLGMPDTRELEVTAAPDVRPAPPESEFTVRMSEFAYEGLPAALPAGKTTLEVANAGEQFHAMEVRRVTQAGTTTEQVTQRFDGTPQPIALTFTAAGGMGELASGDSGWVTLDLEPGVYALICNVFDQGEGGTFKLHVDLGMHHAFSVE